VALVTALAAAFVVALAAHGHSWWLTSAIDRIGSAPARHKHAPRPVAPYWTVRSGDTFAQIAGRTGLTVDELEAFNPQIDPSALAPGERLNLWAHPPRPRPKPPGPRFWMVRVGESFGYIAAKTGIDLFKLEQLNPQLNPATLQPGDRIRLR
jgi:LysM repeat protein